MRGYCRFPVVCSHLSDGRRRPPRVLRPAVGDPSASVDAYSAAALAPEASAVLNALGVGNTMVFEPGGATPGLAFVTAAGLPVQVYITTACSGIYSFAIFASAFTAFVLTEQRRLTPRVLAFFVLGVFFAYAANVLRIVAIVYIGYRFDTPATGIQSLLVAEGNAGWIIFLAWIALFWGLLFRFLPREGPGRAPAGPHKRGVLCAICGDDLTPAVSATRCPCGRFYHLQCLASRGSCPACASPAPPMQGVEVRVA